MSCHRWARAPDERQRDLEFSTEGGLTKGELLDRLESTVSKAIAIMGNLEDDLHVPLIQIQLR